MRTIIIISDTSSNSSFYVSKPAGAQTLKGNTLGHKGYSTVSWQLLKHLNAPSKRYIFCHTRSHVSTVIIFITDTVTLVRNELKLILGRGCYGGRLVSKLRYHPSIGKV